jgi:hypothetical protein
MSKVEPWMWGVISNAVLIRWTLPDPAPDDVADLATLAAIKILASSLSDSAAQERIDSVLQEVGPELNLVSPRLQDALKSLQSFT